VIWLTRLLGISGILKLLVLGVSTCYRWRSPHHGHEGYDDAGFRDIANPELERERRASLAETMCHRVDGKSAERIVSFLLDASDGKSVGEEGMTPRR